MKNSDVISSEPNITYFLIKHSDIRYIYQKNNHIPLKFEDSLHERRFSSWASNVDTSYILYLFALLCFISDFSSTALVFKPAFGLLSTSVCLQMSPNQLCLVSFLLLTATLTSGNQWYRRVTSPPGQNNPPAFLHFKPLQEMSVTGPCDWEIRVTSMEDRIPRRISEIYCRNQRSICAGNPFYQVNLNFGFDTFLAKNDDHDHFLTNSDNFWLWPSIVELFWHFP